MCLDLIADGALPCVSDVAPSATIAFMEQQLERMGEYFIGRTSATGIVVGPVGLTYIVAVLRCSREPSQWLVLALTSDASGNTVDV